MRQGPLRFHAQYAPWSQTFELYVINENVVLRVETPAELPADLSERQPPTMNLTEGETQLLFDALWKAGLRPSAGRDINAIVTAKEEHLADLRGILKKADLL